MNFSIISTKNNDIYILLDLMCQGKLPETVIPIGDGNRYIVCVTDGKGDELVCPRGLYYSLEKRQCDYRKCSNEHLSIGNF